MKPILLALEAALVFGCGSSTVHLDRAKVLECVGQTNFSMVEAATPDATMVLFSSDDGVSALEGVVVGFHSGAAKVLAGSPVAKALGFEYESPTWQEHRGGAEVEGFGPYEPPIAKQQRIPKRRAKAAARVLGARVRAEIDACLHQDRGNGS